MIVTTRSEVGARARVVVASTDAALLERGVAELRAVDATVAVVSALASLSRAYEHCDAIVLFADGFDEKPLAVQLHELEEQTNRPRVVVVTKHPQRWQRDTAREGAAVVLDTAWSWGLVDSMLSGRDLDDPDPSGPELPFTD